MVKIVKILNILSDKIEVEEFFAEDMCRLINLCSYPYYKERTSDELTFEPIITECLANLGEKML